MIRRHLTTAGLRTVACAVVFASGICLTSAADSPQQAYARSWAGTRVMVRQPLYTLVYNERGRMGKTYRARRAGLTVATPFAGTYFQFDGQDSEEDIIEKNPQRVMDVVGETYRRSPMLNDGTFQKIEPLLLVRYDPGVELVVKTVRVEFDRVRLFLVKTASDSEGPETVATTLTIKWPVPLSPALSERPNIEDVIRQFVAVAETRH